MQLWGWCSPESSVCSRHFWTIVNASGYILEATSQSCIRTCLNYVQSNNANTDLQSHYLLLDILSFPVTNVLLKSPNICLTLIPVIR